MKQLRVITIIAIIMMVAVSAFAKKENYVSFPMGITFQTPSNFGVLPFLGFDVGVSVNIFENLNDTNMWLRLLYGRSWQLNIHDPDMSPDEYVKNTIMFGPEILFRINHSNVLLGPAPGFIYRLTYRNDGTYTSKFGVYAEADLQVEVGGTDAWFLINPALNVKYIVDSGFEAELLLRINFRV